MLPKLKHVNVKNEFYNIWRVENLNYITHIHEELEMVYISQGQLEVTIEDTEYLLRAGDICFAGSMQVHKYHSLAYSKCLMIGASPSVVTLCQDARKDFQLECPVIRKAQYSPEMAALFELLLESTDLIQNPGTCIGLINAIFEYLWGVSHQVPRPETFAPVKKVLMYLHQNCFRPITLLTAAEALEMSQYQLSRLCNQQIGMGFNAYLKFLRITAAKRLLVSTDWAMPDISTQCGFESIRTFNRAFKEMTNGLSPSDYRNKQAGISFFQMNTDDKY
ncbi:L-rhamnose operon transcriptional activator rhaR [uncultured Flavonifractor sp.]|nr:L-rhamnose operon transcriptional activator rhaR [uncultured Flavonifractor sp.]